MAQEASAALTGKDSTTFRVKAPLRAYEFRAADPVSAQEWIREINAAASKAQGTGKGGDSRAQPARGLAGLREPSESDGGEEDRAGNEPSPGDNGGGSSNGGSSSAKIGSTTGDETSDGDRPSTASASGSGKFMPATPGATSASGSAKHGGSSKSATVTINAPTPATPPASTPASTPAPPGNEAEKKTLAKRFLGMRSGMQKGLAKSPSMLPVRDEAWVDISAGGGAPPVLEKASTVDMLGVAGASDATSGQPARGGLALTRGATREQLQRGASSGMEEMAGVEYSSGHPTSVGADL
jgi:hypothetical protein